VEGRRQKRKVFAGLRCVSDVKEQLSTVR
jgi:hypothetical protein